MSPFSSAVGMPEWYRFACTHTFNIAVVGETQIHSPSKEKAKTQPEVRMDLAALFYLPAMLQGGFIHILICSHLTALG